jgi:hypothetical protein
MVITMSTYVTRRQRIYRYLMDAHNFQARTLSLLSYKNLKRLALDYGYTTGE